MAEINTHMSSHNKNDNILVVKGLEKESKVNLL